MKSLKLFRDTSDYTSCAITHKNSLYFWNKHQLRPKKVLSNVVKVFKGEYAITKNHKLWKFNKKSGKKVTVKRVAKNVRNIYPAESHLFVLKRNGKLWDFEKGKKAKKVCNSFKSLKITWLLNESQEYTTYPLVVTILDKKGRLFMGEGNQDLEEKIRKIFDKVKAYRVQKRDIHGYAEIRILKKDGTLWDWNYKKAKKVKNNVEKIVNYSYIKDKKGYLWQMIEKEKPVKLMKNVSKVVHRRFVNKEGYTTNGYTSFAVKNNGSVWGWGRKKKLPEYKIKPTEMVFKE